MIQKVYSEYMYEFNPGQSHLGSKYIIKTILVYNFIYKTYRTTLVNAMQHEPMIDHYFTQLTKVNKYFRNAKTGQSNNNLSIFMIY